MHSPKHSFLFGVLLFSVLAAIGVLFPEKGWKAGEYIRFNFPALHRLFSLENEKADISNVLNAIESIDTNFVIEPELFGLQKTDTNTNSVPISDSCAFDSIEQFQKNTPALVPNKVLKEVEFKGLNTGIQSRNGKALIPFFKALSNLKNEPNCIRVLHYGDSQIEGDRMTEYLRLKLQAQFGGEGPGLVSFMPISRSVINRIESGSNWERYSAYTIRDKRIKHNNFGVLAGFCKFQNSNKSGKAAAVISGTLGIITTPLGGGNALNFKKIKLFYGGSKYKTWCEFYEGPVLMRADSLEAAGNFKVKEFKIVSGANKHSFIFKGLDSPDFYGLSLEGNSGVMVDNVALRGSSGTFFQHINSEQLKSFYDYLNVKLIILQFGGNAIPSLLDQSMAVNYGNYLKYQIKLVKKAAPETSILFIGPSDMNIKEGTEYITYPILETVRDEIKKAVLESGCAFFDIYDNMGGKNSMAAWVEQHLAASDYTHFTPQGARKMATILYAELIKEYNAYLKNEK